MKTNWNNEEIFWSRNWKLLPAVNLKIERECYEMD
jgi:hypothetical protein